MVRANDAAILMGRGRVALVCAIAIGCACATRPSERTRELAAGPALVWPQPPQPPRIRFAQAVSRPEDFGIRPSIWQTLTEWLAGKEPMGGFVRPTGVAATDQAIYIADPGSQSLWMLDRAARRARCIHRAGRQPLVSPVAVALGARQRLFLADSYLAKIFVYDTTGRFVAALDIPALRRPAGVAYDAPRDRLYIADSQAHQVWIVSGDGRPLGSIGRRGTAAGEFNFPTHVTVDRNGTVYVTDALGFRVQHFTAEGEVIGQFGRHGDATGDFASPKGLALDSEGHVYVADALFDAVQIFNASGQLLLSFGRSGAGAGEFWLPNGMCIDAQDRLYVADSYNRRIQVFEYLREDHR